MKPLIVLGASLGGIDALGIILSRLPSDLSVPVVVVQHRSADNNSRLVDILNGRSALPVVEPEDRHPVEPGRVYLGPADYHLMVTDEAFYFSTEEPENYARPSIDVLFETAAESSFSPLVGVLLTASSEDGAIGLEKIAKRGGTTIVQDPDQALSPVAILAALRRNFVHHVLPVEEIAPRLVQLSMRGKRRNGGSG